MNIMERLLLYFFDIMNCIFYVVSDKNIFFVEIDFCYIFGYGNEGSN